MRIVGFLCLVPLAACCACSEDAIVESNADLLAVPSFVAEWEIPLKAIAIDQYGSVHATTPDDNLIHVYSLDGQATDVWAVVVDGDTLTPHEVIYRNSQFVVTTFQELVVLDNDRKVVAHWSLSPDRGSGFGADTIDSDLAGNIYVIDDLENEVVKYSPDGIVVARWALGGLGPLLIEYSGIAVTDRGTVYIANRLENRIDVYSGEGVFIHSFGRQGSSRVEFETPWGLDISGGVLYVADLSNYRIQKLTLWGSYLAEFYSAAASGGPGDMPHILCVHERNVGVGFRGSMATYKYE